MCFVCLWQECRHVLCVSVLSLAQLCYTPPVWFVSWCTGCCRSSVSSSCTPSFARSMKLRVILYLMFLYILLMPNTINIVRKNIGKDIHFFGLVKGVSYTIMLSKNARQVFSTVYRQIG